MSEITPTVPGENGDPIAEGWVDSGVVYTNLTITNRGTNVSYTIPGSDLDDSMLWKSVIFKLWVSSSTGSQKYNFTSAYKLSDNPMTGNADSDINYDIIIYCLNSMYLV